jgi:hypothetical protein
MLAGVVQALVGTGTVTPGQGQALLQPLKKVRDDLNRGNAHGSLRELEAFKRHASVFTATGVLGSSTGHGLLAEAGRAEAQITDMAFGAGPARPASWSFEGCAERPPCTYSVVYVDRRAVVLGERDGSQARPYRTLAAALQHAEDRDVCGVEIRLADGVYWENIVLTRHTTLDGESRAGVLLVGSIVNNAGVDLTVRDLRVAAVDGPGGIFTDAPCAVTTVANVVVDRSARFGIYQRGGVLTVLSSVVRRTEAHDDSRFDGTALYLTGGVQAALGVVEISDNASGAIVASGGQTQVYATSVSVTGTGVNPFFRGEAGWLNDVPAAVEVTDDALLLMEFGTISRNELAGLRVRDGGRAHFRYGLIERTEDVPDHENLATGNAVAITDGSILELSHFTLTRGALAALLISGAFATASDGVVSWHPIGAAIQGMPPPSDPTYGIESAVECLEDDVDYARNDRPLDTSVLPLPCIGPDCPAPRCRRVAFVCSWCGN